MECRYPAAKMAGYGINGIPLRCFNANQKRRALTPNALESGIGSGMRHRAAAAPLADGQTIAAVGEQIWGDPVRNNSAGASQFSVRPKSHLPARLSSRLYYYCPPVYRRPRPGSTQLRAAATSGGCALLQHSMLFNARTFRMAVRITRN
jgi:hypothetical protein